jgi:nitrate reductase NapE component
LDPGSETKRLLLTPVTAAGDFIVVVVVVGLALAAVGAYGFAASKGH